VVGQTSHGAASAQPIDSGDGVSSSGARPRRSPFRGMAFRFPVRYRIVWVALALLLILVESTSSATLGAVSLRLTTALAGVLFLVSLGQMLVVMTGGLDITVAPVMTLCGGIIVRETQGRNSEELRAWLIAVAVALIIGLVNGILIVLLRLNALIVTLAMSGIITGGMLVWTGVTFSESGEVPPALHRFATSSLGPVGAIGFVALGVGIVAALVLRGTSLGRRFVAVGTNPVAARIIGIRVVAHRMAAYAMAGILYAVAGALLAGYLGTPDFTLGSPYLLLTFVSVALAGAALSGGPASVLCVLAASCFLALLDEYLAVRGIGGGTSTLLQGAILVLAVGAIPLATRASALITGFRRAVAPGRPPMPQKPVSFDK
jgi:ribose transport system permease protein